MKFAILVFPGTWSERDCQYVLTHELGQQADLIWHRDSNLDGYDAVVIPGGFSYGDHLRTGAIARFSPVMEAVVRHADAGKPVIGICNGFQILCESHLLPGALMRNDSLEFRCVPVQLRIENDATIFTRAGTAGQVLEMPIAHGEGNYFADADTIETLEADGRVIFRYVTPAGVVTAEANPNGSLNNIAGIINERGNVLGMMPHPERAGEPLMGSTDGLVIWRSMIESAVEVIA